MKENERVLQLDFGVINNLFGKLDENIKIVEKAFDVKITNRDNGLKLIGLQHNIGKAEHFLMLLEKLFKKDKKLEKQDIILLLRNENIKHHSGEIELMYDEIVCQTLGGRTIKAKTLGQKKYLESLKRNTITFAVGPAGTGKTYLAIAMAVKLFKSGQVSKIILTRPAIEAGEKLGFLPGDLQQKVDPYLRPLYDALTEIMGNEHFLKNMEKNLIEVAPLAYMRGRTLDQAFIILDEAQNTTQEQMKMFLTRIGYGSKVVVTGDITQIDLASNLQSGLVQAEHILKTVEDIGHVQLNDQDVVRHPLVQKIILAYELFDQKKKK